MAQEALFYPQIILKSISDMKRLSLTFLLIAAFSMLHAQNYELSSPDGKLVVKVSSSDDLKWSLTHSGEVLMSDSPIAMHLADGTVFGGGGKVVRTLRRSVDEVHSAPFYKKSQVEDRFNELTVVYRKFSVVFRAYDEGVAYRFVSRLKKPFKVVKETAGFSFPSDWNMWSAYVTQHTETLESQLWNSFENQYTYGPLSQWNKERLAFLPLMVDVPGGKKICITETDLMNYPGMFLYNGDGDTVLESRHAAYPEKEVPAGNNMIQRSVVERRDYIAECQGGESFPWRIVAVSENDAQMADNDLVWLMATPADNNVDWSWVKLGKVAWDWWNNWNIYGVDFDAGINNDTYKYYIDFASENGIEYVIFDDGWSVGGDLMKVVPEIDFKELVSYADERNVGLILWAGYWPFHSRMEEVCRHYSELGFKGFKIDFMDRDDQPMVAFHREAAEIAAKYHMLVDFHGSYKPSGLLRTYPNVVNVEGVYGLENMKWADVETDQVTYEVEIPFIRMLAGPMDYTQGAMRNASHGNYRPVYSEAMSQGTRCRQLAMYVVYEAPVGMLCDSPSNYMKEPECTGFISSVPTVWDETRALDGRVGDYVVIARRSGEDWYVGGMTDWDARTVEVDLGFLPEGEWSVELFRDGKNAHRAACDYKKESFGLSSDRKLKVSLAPGGGFAAKITKR